MIIKIVITIAIGLYVYQQYNIYKRISDPINTILYSHDSLKTFLENQLYINWSVLLMLLFLMWLI